MKAKFLLVLFAVLIGTTASANSQNSLALTHNTWTSGSPLPIAVSPAGVGVLKGQIYVIGGWNSAHEIIADTQIYTPSTNSWTSGVPLPIPMSGGASAVVKNVLYFVGGWDGGECVNAVWAYNLKGRTWSAKSAMPTARCSISAVVDKDIIYVIGGYSPPNQRLSTVESYDPATDTWTEEAPLLVGKSEVSAGLLGKTIVASDGQSDQLDTGDNEGYNVSTNTWTTLAADPQPRNEACSGSISGRLYVAGGWNNAAVSDSVNSFKLSKNQWTVEAAMPQAVTASGSAVYKGLLYCIGGSSSNFANQGTIYDYVQIYQP